MQRNFISGIIFIASYLHLGPVAGLECITCTWSPGDINGTSNCAYKPFEETAVVCPEPSNKNIIGVCMTMADFRVSGNQVYISKVSRSCGYDSINCNKACNPGKSSECLMCCEGINRCNTFPLSSTLMPLSMYLNATGAAASVTYTADFSSAFIIAVFFSGFSWLL